MKGGGWHWRAGNSRVRFRARLGGKSGRRGFWGQQCPGREGKQGGQESEHRGTTSVSPQRGGRCRLTGPQRRRSTGKVPGHGPRCGTGRTHSGLGSTEPEPPLPPPPAAVAAASAKPSFRHPRRRLTTCRPRPLLEPRRAPGNDYGQSQAQEAAVAV